MSVSLGNLRQLQNINCTAFNSVTLEERAVKEMQSELVDLQLEQNGP